MKIITYNIDGLPESLNLNDLPWIFKPLVWVYKWIKKTTIITINDNTNKEDCMNKIASYLYSSNADIICVQEDFNYHSNIINVLSSLYNSGTHLGGFDLSKIFSNTEWLSYFPLPRFKCDGLNIYTKKDIVVQNETIISWKKNCGYFSNANDALTHKGFRYYQLKIKEGVILNVFNIHMDANFYTNNTEAPKDLKARKSQLIQLSDYILKLNSDNPTIIIGDTNSYDKYIWDADNIYNNLIYRMLESDYYMKEITPIEDNDCDKIFCLQKKNSKFKIKTCYFDKGMEGISDHKPLVMEFDIIQTNSDIEVSAQINM